MALPFKPLTITFQNLNYYVDVPAVRASPPHDLNHLHMQMIIKECLTNLRR